MATATADLTSSIPVLAPREFDKISKLAYQHFGLDLSNGKQGLVAARLGKKLRELGMTSFEQYFDHVVQDKTGAALTAMVDYLTTNHTSFFREPRHFDLLTGTIYPALRSRSTIHIWSAACSSGEEPYTIAMSLLETAPHEAEDKVRIRATDISTRVLEKGRQGVYRADRFDNVPAPLMQRYLLKGQGTAAESFRFKPAVRRMIDFRHLNLMDKLPADYTCSVIFCRNILIYFDKPTVQEVVRKLTACLEDGGYLFIGHSESLNSIAHDLTYISPATYRKTRPTTPSSLNSAVSPGRY